MIRKLPVVVIFALACLFSLNAQPAIAIERPACTCKVVVQGAGKCGIPNQAAQKHPEVGIPYDKPFKVRDLLIPEIASAMSRGGPQMNLSYCPPYKKTDPGIDRNQLENLLANPPSYKISSPEDCDKFTGGDVAPLQWDGNPSYNGFYAIETASCKTTYSTDASAVVLSGKPENYHGPLPDCAFYNIGCRNTNELLQLLVNIGNFTFAAIGTWALVAFVYGGVMMIISMGNSEQFSKGKDALVAAVIGLVISLSAYLIINFILDALGVSPEFRPPTTAVEQNTEADGLKGCSEFSAQSCPSGRCEVKEENNAFVCKSKIVY